MATMVKQKALSIAPASAAMNAKPYESVAAAREGHESVLEPKLDGHRLLAQVTESGVHLWTRNGNDKAAHLPHVASEIAENFPAGTWLDGEAIIAGGKEIGGSNTVQKALGGNPKHAKVYCAVEYVAFDLLAHGGIDARMIEFGKRRSLLETIFGGAEFESIRLIEQLPAVEESHEILLANGYEGSMVKWLDGKYLSGKRGCGQGKLKAKWTIDAVIMGYKPGENSFTGLIGAVIFGQYDGDGNLVERGRCSGMNMKTREYITKYSEELIGSVIEVGHMGSLQGDGLRHPQFKKFRADKDAKDCVIHNG